MAEFSKYVPEFGEPNILKVLTPSGGEHYYFILSHQDPNTQTVIKQFLGRTLTKMRGAGVDIRSEGGMVVGPPSLRDGKPYKAVVL